MAITALLCLAGGQSARAAKSTVYEHFTKCPTGSAAMNDPSKGGAVCAASVIRGGFIRVGGFQAAITSPMLLQFAFVSDPVPEAVAEIVPGSTSLDAAPTVIPNLFYKPPAPAAAPPPAEPKKSQKKKGKMKHKHRKHGKHKKHKKKKKGKKKKAAPVTPAPAAPEASDPNVRITPEVAGDLRNLNLEPVFGGAGPLFELPLKMHLEGAGLGPACYVGSSAEPILLAPVLTVEPTSFQFGVDPNGFKVETLSLDGAGLEDETFTVPGASGCGIPADSLDGQVNSLVGLPAVAGGSKTLFDGVLITMAAAINDGKPPESGAELQAAFEAAK